ncbi:hypothetical protein CLV62_13630 [Dysgonomonas alginatilytica]|uniref:Uncharacterized protein n=1 Tax=Dysgonomonas alginatilytica TaxID=1605892 RepID=A0A2V3PJC8_9BACT|nr:hypothetical protein CLV62_13630 [Dysgonomonas alginatilytica]
MNRFFTNRFELLLVSIGLFIIGIGVFISSLFIKPFEFMNTSESLIYITYSICILSLRKNIF